MLLFVLVVLGVFCLTESKAPTTKKPIPPDDVHLPEFLNHPNWYLLPTKRCGDPSRGPTYYDDDPDPNPFDDPPSERRIFEGKDADRREFPWVAAFFISDKDFEDKNPHCGATIISDKYVLTAAHCCQAELRKQEAGDSYIQVGGYSMDDLNADCKLPKAPEACDRMPKNYVVESTISHPDYNNNDYTSDSDICLVRLKDKLTFHGRVEPICLPTYRRIINRTFNGRKLQSAGWGLTGKVTRWFIHHGRCPTCVYPSVLQKAWLPVVQNNECVNWFKRNNNHITLTDKQMCAGGVVVGRPGTVVRKACDGDSGGSLFTGIVINSTPKWYNKRYFMYGIVSYGQYISWNNVTYCGVITPNVLTRVSKFIPWILDNMVDDAFLAKPLLK